MGVVSDQNAVIQENIKSIKTALTTNEQVYLHHADMYNTLKLVNYMLIFAYAFFFVLIHVLYADQYLRGVPRSEVVDTIFLTIFFFYPYLIYSFEGYFYDIIMGIWAYVYAQTNVPSLDSIFVGQKTYQSPVPINSEFAPVVQKTSSPPATTTVQQIIRTGNYRSNRVSSAGTVRQSVVDTLPSGESSQSDSSVEIQTPPTSVLTDNTQSDEATSDEMPSDKTQSDEATFDETTPMSEATSITTQPSAVVFQRGASRGAGRNITPMATNQSTFEIPTVPQQNTKQPDATQAKILKHSYCYSQANDGVCKSELVAEGECGSKMKLDESGQLFVYDKNGQAVWISGWMGMGKAPYKLILQDTGDLVIKDATNITKWSSGSSGKGKKPYMLVLNNTGNLSIHDSTGVSIWNTGTENKCNLPPRTKPQLPAGSVCKEGEICKTQMSADNKCGTRVVIQNDGNFVMYDNNPGARWASNPTTKGRGPYKFTMQKDGNMVVYDSSRKPVPIWKTDTNGKGVGPYSLVMQKDGNLVVYDGNITPLWQSGTRCS